MIPRSPGRSGSDPVKSQLSQIEFVNKDIDHLDGIVLLDPVRLGTPETTLPAREPCPQQSASCDPPMTHSRITLR